MLTEQDRQICGLGLKYAHTHKYKLKLKMFTQVLTQRQ